MKKIRTTKVSSETDHSGVRTRSRGRAPMIVGWLCHAQVTASGAATPG